MTPPVRTTSPKPSWLARVADRFGATASFLCAVHCAALPLVIAALPAIGLGFLANHRFERGFIAFASVLALSTLIMGFRRHRQFRAFWFLVPGILLLTAGIIVDFEQSATLHAVLVSIGGTLVAVSHLTNLRLAHGHVHDAACEH
jgi:MerC mercury resistance protein